MSLHKISITNSSAFHILISVCLRTRALVKFAKSRVGKCSCERYLIFYVLLNRFSLQFLQLSLRLRKSSLLFAGIDDKNRFRFLSIVGMVSLLQPFLVGIIVLGEFKANSLFSLTIIIIFSNSRSYISHNPLLCLFLQHYFLLMILNRNR